MKYLVALQVSGKESPVNRFTSGKKLMEQYSLNGKVLMTK